MKNPAARFTRFDFAQQDSTNRSWRTSASEETKEELVSLLVNNAGLMDLHETVYSVFLNAPVDTFRAKKL